MRGTPDTSALAKKFRGALVGAAVGDALGARFEGAPSATPSELERLVHEPGPLRYTDDTHMTIGMAQSLVERKGFDGAHMATLFSMRFMEEPWRGYGPGPPRVFAMLRLGASWDEAGRSLFGGCGSFGNGAAMRVAPAALLEFRNVAALVSLAERTAIITHTHPLGIEGTVVQACAVAFALRADSANALDRTALLDHLREVAASNQYAEKLDHVQDLLTSDKETRAEVVARLGHGIEATDSVPAALFSFLRSPESFKDAVTYAISLGGDTDTIASMAGAIAGGFVGVEGIPEQWRDGVEDSAALQDLADSLLALAQA